MTILIGMVAIEFLGMLALAGLHMVGLGEGPWMLPSHAAIPVAFVIGFFGTYALGRALDVIDVGQIDAYRDRVDAMSAMAESGRRVRATTHRAPRRLQRRAVIIEY